MSSARSTSYRCPIGIAGQPAVAKTTEIHPQRRDARFGQAACHTHAEPSDPGAGVATGVDDQHGLPISGRHFGRTQNAGEAVARPELQRLLPPARPVEFRPRGRHGGGGRASPASGPADSAGPIRGLVQRDQRRAAGRRPPATSRPDRAGRSPSPPRCTPPSRARAGRRAGSPPSAAGEALASRPAAANPASRSRPTRHWTASCHRARSRHPASRHPRRRSPTGAARRA